MNNTTEVNKAKSIILLKDNKNGAWHYMGRSTNVKETTEDLKQNPLNFGDHFSFHGVYESYLQTLSVAKQIHEKEILTQVRRGNPYATLNTHTENLYD